MNIPTRTISFLRLILLTLALVMTANLYAAKGGNGGGKPGGGGGEDPPVEPPIITAEEILFRIQVRGKKSNQLSVAYGKSDGSELDTVVNDYYVHRPTWSPDTSKVVSMYSIPNPDGITVFNGVIISDSISDSSVPPTYKVIFQNDRYNTVYPLYKHSFPTWVSIAGSDYILVSATFEDGTYGLAAIPVYTCKGLAENCTFGVTIWLARELTRSMLSVKIDSSGEYLLVKEVAPDEVEEYYQLSIYPINFNVDIDDVFKPTSLGVVIDLWSHYKDISLAEGDNTIDGFDFSSMQENGNPLVYMSIKNLTGCLKNCDSPYTWSLWEIGFNGEGINYMTNLYDSVDMMIRDISVSPNGEEIIYSDSYRGLRWINIAEPDKPFTIYTNVNSRSSDSIYYSTPDWKPETP